VAVRLTLAGDDQTVEAARVVLGCVGATPVRARRAESLMAGKKLAPEWAMEAARLASTECSPTSDLRGSEDYKRAVVKTLVKRAAEAAYRQALGG
jgi:carbon-monoxide dehydrogenase medium subunit